MKYILCGGGTGGHVMPAIAIADEIKKRDKNAVFLFIGRKNGRENQATLDRGYKLSELEVYGLSFKINKENLKRAYKTLTSIKAAKELIISFKPDVIIGTGGYVCFPVIRAGAALKIPCFIHESNSVAGRTTKSVQSLCEQVFTGFPHCEGLKKRTKTSFTGTPVRREFMKRSREQSRHALKIPDGKFFVLSFGGSGGAEKFNNIMLEVINKSEDPEIEFMHISGERYYPELSKHFIGKRNAGVYPYIKNIADYMSAADLIICRAGALTISEIGYLNKAAILIPSPNVKNNHQFKNADAVSKAGAAILLNEKKLTSKALLLEIEELKGDGALLSSLSKNCSLNTKKNSGEIIAREITNYLSNLSAPK